MVSTNKDFTFITVLFGSLNSCPKIRSAQLSTVHFYGYSLFVVYNHIDQNRSIYRMETTEWITQDY